MSNMPNWLVPEDDRSIPTVNMVQGKKYTRVFTYPDILHTGKKVRLQICIDHKMFNMFTSRNVKKNL